MYLEGHSNCITGSRVTGILLNELILPIGGASSVEGLGSTGLPRIVLTELWDWIAVSSVMGHNYIM